MSNLPSAPPSNQPPVPLPGPTDQLDRKANLAKRLSQALRPPTSAEASRDWLANWLTVALVVRLLLMALPVGFLVDLNSFEAWAIHLQERGPFRFYSTIWSDYPPAYMYVLWVLGWINHVVLAIVGAAGAALGRTVPTSGGFLVFLVKLPGALADVANAWLVFKILEGRVSMRSAARSALVFAFNPVTIFVSAIWGQMDAVLLFALLCATYLTLNRAIEAAIVVSGLAVLIKPQGLFLVPALLATQWFRFPARRWMRGIATALLLGWLVTLPFSWTARPVGWLGTKVAALPGLVGPLLSPLPFLWEKMLATAATYPYSSVNAFSLWAPTGMWKPDTRTVLFVQHRVLGLALLLGLFLGMAWLAWRNRERWTTANTLMVFAIVMVGCFVLPTRMHERYLFPAVGFLALAAGANRHLRWNYGIFSFGALVNILFAYFVYYSPGKWWDPWRNWLESGGGTAIVMLNMWVLGDTIGSLVGGHAEPGDRYWYRPYLEALVKVDRSVRQAWSKLDSYLVGGICTLFFALGVWNLFTPNEQIFDEVYHARTAKEFIDGTNPYEWTHPHLGKLCISAGIMATHQVNRLLEAVGLHTVVASASPPAGAVPVGFYDGFDGFGWRISSLIVGSLTLGLVYVLARRMFGQIRIAGLATGLLAIDGVFFVQSRVAMTNIYVVFFLILGAIGLWEYLDHSGGLWLWGRAQEPARPWFRSKEVYLLWWGIGIGCGLASRWSALYAWGIGAMLIGLDWFWQNRQQLSLRIFKPSTWRFFLRLALYLGVIPVAIYLLSYVPWMLQAPGHSLKEVWQLQHNMYHYHADMTATHNYQSAWFSWPLMLRPTWYYFHDWKNGNISGIVAIGNPAIWWLYLPVMAILVWVWSKTKDLRVGFLAIFGLGLWLVWGIEPRKLVFMHYMFETIPFLTIGLAWILHRYLGAVHQDEELRLSNLRSYLQQYLKSDPASPCRTAALCYLAAAVLLFGFFYPILAAIPISWPYYSAHIWFKTWY